jgi:hypothetical protein
MRRLPASRQPNENPRMGASPLVRHGSTPSELQERQAADRAGIPYIVFRNGDDRQVIHTLDADTGRVALGRSPRTAITLGWDAGVSWTHAVLEHVGDDWVIGDDGLSRNGTYVNHERVAGRRRLRHDDHIRLGSTILAFRAPRPGAPDDVVPITTVRADGPPRMSEAQRGVLVALCRPYFVEDRAYPATNNEIATDLERSVVTVKGHLRALWTLFGIGALPPSRKRAELLHRAVATGAVSADDYS